MADNFAQWINFTHDSIDKAANVFFGIDGVKVKKQLDTFVGYHQPRPPVAVQLAGISGGMAVAFAAYGAHFGMLFITIKTIKIQF